METTAENGTAAPELPVGAEAFAIVKQFVELDVNFRDKSVSGVSTIWFLAMDPDLDEVAFDARQCEIDLENVTVDGIKTTATFSDPYDLAKTPPQWNVGAAQHHVVKKRLTPLRPARRSEVPIKDREQLPCCVPADRALKVRLRPSALFPEEPRRTLKIKPSRADKRTSLNRPDPSDEDGLKISIPFRLKNIRDGLHFVGVDEGDVRYPHVYTRHSIEPGTACCIFPCVDDPGSRHAWKVSIKCPRTLGDVFQQPSAAPPAAAQTTNGNRKRKLGEALPTPPPSPRLAEEDKLKEMTVVCSGNLTGEQIDPQDDKKKIMTFESPLSSAQQIAFAIGPFEHVQLWSEFRTEEADEKLGANAAKIHGYCLPGRRDEVLHTCAPVVAAADFFAPEFGRYPFESYKVCFVEDMIPDTVAATSMSLCSTRLLYSEDIIDPEIDVTRRLVHALASQYFGVHIVPNQRSDSWLIVGIQWFMTDLFMRSLCGNNWYRFHLKTLSDHLVAVDVRRPSLYDLGEHLYIGDFELDFMSLKAPLVLFILDQRMSKIPGSMGIVRVISQIVSNANINATPATTSLSDADFKRACEKKSQYKPDELWQQYVHGAGCPKLLVKQRFNKKNLNVDISIAQTQAKDNGPKAITKEDFLKELLEEVHEVWAGTVPKLFTGPFTVRIHEADGTPYEHFLAITDKDKMATTLQIAYNTKYKRMKRTKRATAAAAVATNAADKHDIQEDDIVYFNMLGDVLMTPRDLENWGLQDWSETVQAAMDQESYEWIRLDCNFEWLCEMMTDMPGYMYLAQLQQDRDVVAHQDAMLFFRRGKRHGVASTIETRTVMDRRYYHGIRTMAVEDLPKQADPDLNYIGKAQLILVFRHFFCGRMVAKNGSVTFPPAPNDFHDKAQYAVQCALPGAIARTRENGCCSRDARNFLLDLLLFNDNSENEYSDQFYVAELLEAVTTSIIPDRREGERDILSSLDAEDDGDLELKRFIEKVIEEIDKYRRMDEWTLTFQNMWTTTALNCKMRLMKAGVIPVAPLEFVQYLQDGNFDLIRIKAFECLVELGLLSKVAIMKLLLASVGSDPSPFVRDRLFKIFCKGMAAIGLGENKAAEPEPEAVVDDSGLIIEQGEAEIQQRKLDAMRNQSIQQTVTALKKELKGNTELQAAVWRAVESPHISLKEKFQLLTICSAMFEPDDSLIMTFKYPTFWKCTRVPAANENPPSARSNGKKRCIVRFTRQYRTRPRYKRWMDFAPPPPPPEEKPPEPKKIKLSSKPSFSGPSNSMPPTPAPGPLVRKDSISVTVPRPAVPGPTGMSSSDSISVQPFARLLTPLAGSPPPAAAPNGQMPNGTASLAAKRPKQPKKRKSDEGDGSARPKKAPRTENVANGRRSKIVVLPFKAWDRLPPALLEKIKAEQAAAASASSTIVATPAAAKRAAVSGGRDSQSAASQASQAGPSSQDPRPSPGISAAPPAVKKRKPLPSSAPHPLAQPPATAVKSTEPPKLIKLKLPPKAQPQGPPAQPTSPR